VQKSTVATEHQASTTDPLSDSLRALCHECRRLVELNKSHRAALNETRARAHALTSKVRRSSIR
jgi:hypothetical protein